MTLRRFVPLMLIVLATACGRESTTPGAVANTDLPADNVIHGLIHRMSKDGIRTAELRGDTAFLFEAERRFDLQGVYLLFFAETGQQSGTLTSRTGEYRMGSGAFIARGNVILVTEGPQGTRRVETEELHYDVGGDQIWSDVDFVMIEGNRTTRGSSFRSDARFETWTITDARTEGGVAQPSGGISF
jgi:LPS export ABC transporter protein LptC